jgi:hypothetical protein
LENGEGMKPYILVELNPKILGIGLSPACQCFHLKERKKSTKVLKLVIEC